MPHVIVLYTGNLDGEPAIGALCQGLATALRGVRDEAAQPVFPLGGIRVLAYPAAHWAVADGAPEHAFCWIHLRMGRGRSATAQQAAGAALTEAARAHFAPVLERRRMGLTVQVDEGAEVFDAKVGNLHAWFAGRASV